jgi:S-formylglutathione hydrolase
LISALKNPIYKSCSAFAPIANPINSLWGQKIFTGYLGLDKSEWKNWDATELIKSPSIISQNNSRNLPILIDQGADDQFLKDGQLCSESFVNAANGSFCKVEYRLHEGYDHSYWFIQTFIRDHLEFHSKYLQLHKS